MPKKKSGKKSHSKQSEKQRNDKMMAAMRDINMDSSHMKKHKMPNRKK